jgi:hypothetical protein
MESVPAIFIVFKVSVLSIGMFFAVKWHYDQGKKNGVEKQRAVLLACGKLVAAFVVLAVVLLLLVFRLGTMLGIDLTNP